MITFIKRFVLLIVAMGTSLEGLIGRLEETSQNFKAIFPMCDKNISNIFRTKQGEEKLIKISEMSDFLVSTKFNSYHCFCIVVGRSWKEKLDWIAENYSFFKENGLSNNKLALTFNTKDWKAKTKDWSANRDSFDL